MSKTCLEFKFLKFFCSVSKSKFYWLNKGQPAILGFHHKPNPYVHSLGLVLGKFYIIIGIIK